ncbi:DUF421 domain-containing protein [Parvularcula dongshanensis]|nr:YetF domain-containing protein [Parvularcula dongshanensis]
MNEKEAIWFGGWDGLFEVILVSPIIYLLVIVFVRVSGKRTTGQMNNFDWIVTVAMGSVVASGIVINTVEVVEAAAAVAMLTGLQFALTSLTRRFRAIDRLAKTEPCLLVRRGKVDERALAKERLTKDELAAALRQHGLARLDEIEWLLLENTGRFSVITKDAARGGIDNFLATDELDQEREK